MTVKHIVVGFHVYDVEGDGYQPIGNVVDTTSHDKVDNIFLNTRKHFFNTLFLASNAKVNPPDEEHQTRYAIGDPTEAALISLAQKIGIDTEKSGKTYAQLHQYGFDSVRKMMSSVRVVDGQKTVYVK
jgi:Ca2+-transporting ATPase